VAAPHRRREGADQRLTIYARCVCSAATTIGAPSQNRPLQLMPAVPWPDPPEIRPEDLYSELVRLYTRPLPLPGETR
jgi:hypothetical protein